MTDRLIESLADDIEAAREAALVLVAEAWNLGDREGIDQLTLAHASLSAALATMVHQHGEEDAALMVASLADRIRQGEYSLHRTLQ